MTIEEDRTYILEILSHLEHTQTKNYYEIPVNAWVLNEENTQKFNRLVCWLKASEFFKIKRTKSGGICVDKGKGAIFPSFDVRKKPTGFELTIVSNVLGSYRIQLRNSTKDLFEEAKMKISGKTAYYKFKELCLEFGIDLANYEENDIKKAEATKESIPEAKICFSSDRIENMMLYGNNGRPATFNKMFHIDFHSSFMSGLVNTHPEFKAVVEHVYNNRKKDNLYYKSILNMTFGYMQSEYIKYKHSHLSKDMLVDNNNRIDKLTKDLLNNDKVPILYNTDGIWYYSSNGEPYHGDGEGPGIGCWENDHFNCEFRCKSKGAYEYMEDGKYHPVVRGFTKYDKIEPDRSKWSWGDIFREEASVISFSLKNDYIMTDKEIRGVIEYEEI